MFGYVIHDTNGQDHGKALKIPWCLLNETCMALMELGWEKVPNWECMFVHRKQGLFLSVCVDDIKIMAPIWKELMKNVDLDEPTLFIDHVYLGCTQRECKPNETIIEQFGSVIGGWLGRVCTTLHLHAPNITYSTSASFVCILLSFPCFMY